MLDYTLKCIEICKDDKDYISIDVKKKEIVYNIKNIFNKNYSHSYLYEYACKCNNEYAKNYIINNGNLLDLLESNDIFNVVLDMMLDKNILTDDYLKENHKKFCYLLTVNDNLQTMINKKINISAFIFEISRDVTEKKYSFFISLFKNNCDDIIYPLLLNDNVFNNVTLERMKDNNGVNILSICIKENNIMLIDYIMQKFPDLLYDTCNLSYNPFIYAIIGNNIITIKHLREYYDSIPIVNIINRKTVIKMNAEVINILQSMNNFNEFLSVNLLAAEKNKILLSYI